jgi:hypothetical protein
MALLNQEAIYGAAVPFCTHGLRAPLYAVPALCVAVVAVVIVSALVTFRRSTPASTGHQNLAATAGRTHFLAGLAIMTGGVSALVILAQWLAVFVFQPCLKA